jgi:FADH2 O2-dependent halogenase
VTDQYDIAIVGSGFAGSLLAMIARRLGRSVILIERHKHPRVVIGESSTPLTNLLLEDLATRYDLPAIKPLAKWGTWQKTHPAVACGLKRGFTFYHHNLDKPEGFPPNRDHQLLVAASPHDEIADTHWYRADFDHLLVCEAQKLGVYYLDETKLTQIIESQDKIELSGTRNDQPITISTKFLIDASGPRGFLHHALRLGEKELPHLPSTQALYSHFSGIGRIESQFVATQQDQPPYPVDSAAVHHLFDGGWIWVLQFNNGITSAGIAATDIAAARWNLHEGEAAWNRILDTIPSLRNQFAKAKAEQPFRHIPQLSFRSATITGKRWALLPSASGFIDPLLSTGFPLTLLGVDRLASMIEHHWESPDSASHLEAYATETDADLLAATQLIGSLYANLNNFPVFASLTLLYFAAVSFSETAHRLGKPELASSFLLRNHPRFGSTSTQLFERARDIQTQQQADQLSADILRAIEPFNVAGLGKPHLRNWYPVDAQDLFDNAAKLNATQQDIQQLLHRCGFDLE